MSKNVIDQQVAAGGTNVCFSTSGLVGALARKGARVSATDASAPSRWILPIPLLALCLVFIPVGVLADALGRKRVLLTRLSTMDWFRGGGRAARWAPSSTAHPKPSHR